MKKQGSVMNCIPLVVFIIYQI